MTTGSSATSLVTPAVAGLGNRGAIRASGCSRRRPRGRRRGVCSPGRGPAKVGRVLVYARGRMLHRRPAFRARQGWRPTPQAEREAGVGGAALGPSRRRHRLTRSLLSGRVAVTRARTDRRRRARPHARRDRAAGRGRAGRSPAAAWSTTTRSTPSSGAATSPTARCPTTTSRSPRPRTRSRRSAASSSRRCRAPPTAASTASPPRPSCSSAPSPRSARSAGSSTASARRGSTRRRARWPPRSCSRGARCSTSARARTSTSRTSRSCSARCSSRPAGRARARRCSRCSRSRACCVPRRGCSPSPTSRGCGARRARARPGSIVLAVAAPVLWALGDLAVTGDPLHSLLGTRDNARDARADHRPERGAGDRAAAARRDPPRARAVRRGGRRRSSRSGGCATARASAPSRASSRSSPSACSPPPACRSSAATSCCPPRSSRSSAAPARSAGRACRATTARRRPWAWFGARTLVLLVVFTPAQVDRVRALRHALARQDGDPGRPRRARPRPARRDPGRVRARDRAEPPPGAAARALLDTDPTTIVSAQEQRPRRGTWVTPADASVARDYMLDPRDRDKRIAPPPVGMRLAGGNASWRVFARC